MKSKLWLFQIPIVALFAWAYWVHEAGIQGKLQNAFLRETLFPKLQTIAGQHTNLKFQTRGPQAPKNKIVIAEIDNDSIEEYGRWPWHRDKTAMLVQSIFDAGAKFVALDITFSEPDQRVSDELATFLKEKKFAESMDGFETDHNLETVFAFNSGKAALGWMAARECQPAFQASNPLLCPVDDPEFINVPKEMAKFAVKDQILSRPLDLRKIPLVYVPNVLSNLKMYNDAADHAGFLNTYPEPDGYIRRTQLVLMGADGHLYPSLALATAAAVLNDEIEVKLNDRQTIDSLRFKKSGRAIPVSPLGMMEINFRGGAQSFQYIKAREIMAPEEQIRIEVNRQIASVSKKELLKDAIVFVGVTAIGVFDMRAFPFDSNVAGVEGHANILDNLLSGDMLRHGDGNLGMLWIYLIMTAGALFFAFAVERLESIPAILLFIAVMGGGWYVDQKILFASNESWNTSLLMLEISSIFLITFAIKYVMEEKNKKFIRGAFAKYVSPTIIDSIMKDPSKLTVGGEKRDLTIVFSDIRSFTSFSEKMDAKTLSTFLNEYLGQMTDIVFETEGTLDKYIGDAVMAFWGAPLDQPKHSVNACKAAIKMQQALNARRPYFREKYGIEVNVGIGVHSGSVSVGNMGSERIFEYTVIGDHVNLASRIEGLTKDYHSKILTTRSTMDLIAQTGEPLPPHRVLDFVKVKGKKVAVELIQVLDVEMPKEGLDEFLAARELYAKQEWDAAIAKFEICSKLLAIEGVEDEMSKEFIERCKEFKIDPPGADWDGAWVMKTK
ncbi:MAG: adenylate/guanylate cyclase domain-containing protein [Bdellovibrionales bacterium]|nr:adenylate/guanylate cyclase domain-containing protein [Bdellovibrionales bacterium]